MNKTLKLTTIALSVLTLMLTSAPVFAEHGSDDSSNTSTTATTTSHKETEQEIEQDQLAAAKLKACGVKKNAVSGIESRVGKRAQGRLDAITKIATKVENYVTTNNLTVTNYDSLVSDISAKKATAQAAVDKVKSEVGSVGSVTCSGGDGKAQVEIFKKDMRAQQNALKAYRESVKVLVKAVKAAKTSTGGEQE